MFLFLQISKLIFSYLYIFQQFFLFFFLLRISKFRGNFALVEKKGKKKKKLKFEKKK